MVDIKTLKNYKKKKKTKRNESLRLQKKKIRVLSKKQRNISFLLLLKAEIKKRKKWGTIYLLVRANFWNVLDFNCLSVMIL